MLTFRQKISRNLINVLGFRTDRQIIVIESDDWGSIRMPSRPVYDTLLKENYRVDECPYCKYDSLANADDLSSLFEVLTAFKDKNGRSPIITANTVVANPDFEKIRASGFQNYYYEPFTETLNRYSSHSRVFDLWNEGIVENIFHPQFHAREHLNVNRWMTSLQCDDKLTHKAFDNQMISISSLAATPDNKSAFMDSFNFNKEEEIDFLAQNVKEGLELFNSIFGFSSKSFIGSCYIWDQNLEKVLSENGVSYLQGVVVHKQPIISESASDFKLKYHYLGQENRFKQRYLLRNVFFEPSHNPNFDWIGDCMNRIETAFRWGKPATISVHRLNFIGHIDSENRQNNLSLFKMLLNRILLVYPNVEFMTSDELGDLISKK